MRFGTSQQVSVLVHLFNCDVSGENKVCVLWFLNEKIIMYWITFNIFPFMTQKCDELSE